MKTIKKNWWLIILAILILWGGFLRFQSLGKQSFWMDEAFSVATATAIQERGYPLLDTGKTSWDAFPVNYIMSAGLSLFDDPQTGGRVFSALAGVLLILVFYFFNFRIFKSKREALIATTLMTFMTYEIAWSRQARMYIFLQFLITSSIYFYYRFLQEKKKIPLVLAFVFGALAIYTHQAGYLAAIVIFLTAIIDVKEIKPWGEWIKKNKGFFAGFLITFALFAYSLFLIKSDSSLVSAAGNAESNMNMDYSLNYIRFLLSQLGLLLPIGVIGFFIMAWRKKWMYTLAIAISAVIYFLLISFRNELFHLRYILPIVPFILIFAAYAIDQLFEYLKKYHIAVSILTGIIVIAIMFTGRFNFLPKNEYLLDPTAPQPDWKAGYEWIKNDSEGKEVTTISTLPVFHDIYIGKENGEKYFLPFTFSGLPDSYEEESNYAKAGTIESLAELKEKKGYLILDDFGLNMLRDKDIKDYLDSVSPVIFNGHFKLMVWKL